MTLFVNYEKDPVKYKKRVFFTGKTAITIYDGLCYDRDYDDGTDPADAVDAWGKRDKCVAVPSQSNNNAFAGVACQSYAASATGQWIDIYEPKSVCLVNVIDSSATIGELNFVTCIAGGTNAGKFTATPTPIMGKGVARVMQTLTAAGTCLVELMDGQESGLVEIIPTATLTAGGAITCMVSGVTYFTGPATPASDCTFILANGTYIGQMKRFYLSGALTTNDVLITITAGEQLDGSTDLASLELDADKDDSLLIWTGSKWRLLGNAGTGLA
jgi:hypothetical protein